MSNNKDSEMISSSAQGEWVGYWESPIAGENELKLPEQYAVLLVLEGEIVLTFKGHGHKTIDRKSLIVIDRRQLTHFEWAAGTAVLEFTPPKKIFRFFASCGLVFNIPCSSTVPVLPPLQKWIDDLMTERLQPKEMLTDIRRREWCVKLASILLENYPALLAGELLIPFKACSISGEKRCKCRLCE